MAAEDDIPQSIRDLDRLFRQLNDTVKSTSERQADFQKRVKDNEEALKIYARTIKGTADAEKLYNEKRAALEADNVRRARAIAQEQLEAEKQTKTFGFQLMKNAGASIENQKALLVWGSRLKTTGDVLSTLGGGVGKFAADLAQGSTKFTALNPLIDAVSSALGKMAEAIPFAGNAVSGALKLAAEAAKFMMGQLQAATEAFQEISRVGASGADGMEGVMRQFQASGMTLQGFIKAVKDNSSALAAFGGTAASGAEALSKISQNIIDSEAGDYLRRLGFTADEMGESTARFIAQQQRLGATQNKSTQQLAQGSAAYLKELDLLAKVTGQSREAQQEAINAQLREGRFLSTMRIMEREGRGKEAAELQKLSLATGAYNDELSAAIRDASSGIIDSEVVKQFTVAGIDILGAVNQIKLGGGSAEQVFRNLQNQVRQVLPQQEQFAQYLEAGNKTFPTLYKNVDFANAAFNTAGAQGEQANVQANKLTGNTADAQKSMEQMSRQVSALATSILPNFSSAISKATGVMNQMLQAMGVPGVVGGGTAGGAPGGGAPGGGAPGGGAAVTPGGGGAAAGAFLGDLRLKSKEAISGGEASPAIYNLAKQIQNTLGENLLYFSAFNDTYERGPNSKHGKGMALDFTLRDPSQSAAAASTVASILSGRGRVIDEYLNPSKSATGGHIHAELFRTGGIAVGPKSGYAATLHGTEAVIPLPDGKTIPVEMTDFTNSMGQQMSVMSAQLMKLEEIVSAMRDNNAISSKILQATNNLT